MNTQDSSVATVSSGQGIKQSAEDISGAPIYFAVSPLKLVVMSICTMGIYELYWFYKNWVLIKERESLDIKPFLESLLCTYLLLLFLQKSSSFSGRHITSKINIPRDISYWLYSRYTTLEVARPILDSYTSYGYLSIANSDSSEQYQSFRCSWS